MLSYRPGTKHTKSVLNEGNLHEQAQLRVSHKPRQSMRVMRLALQAVGCALVQGDCCLLLPLRADWVLRPGCAVRSGRWAGPQVSWELGLTASDSIPACKMRK